MAARARPIEVGRRSPYVATELWDDRQYDEVPRPVREPVSLSGRRSFLHGRPAYLRPRRPPPRRLGVERLRLFREVGRLPA